MHYCSYFAGRPWAGSFFRFSVVRKANHFTRVVRRHMRTPLTTPVIASLCFLFAACNGDGTGVGNGGTTTGATLSGDVQPILTTNCALSGCHAGTSPQEGQNLSAGQTFSNVVNVPSNELPTMRRVQPNQPDSSYLVHKIQGTHVSVGGTGDRMPQGRTPLSQSDINVIREWIQNGATAN